MGTLKNKEISNNDVSMITYFVFAIFILLLIIGICFVGIAISSKKDTESIISILNNVGGAIGGITSPIVGIISIVLVYMAYNQQLKANEYLKIQLLDARLLQKNRYQETRNLILFDLNSNIKPQIRDILVEIAEAYSKAKEWHIQKAIFFKIYNHLNTYTFDAIDKKEIYTVFGDNYKDLIFIYSNIGYIKSRTLEFTHKELLQISESKNTDLSNKSEEVKIFHINNLKIAELCNEIIMLIDGKFPQTT